MNNKKTILFLLFSFLFLQIFAERYWIVSPTYLYENPKEEITERLGLLVRGAEVKILSSDIAATWIKVKVDNNQEGYILSRFVKNRLNSKDEYEISPAPIIENDGYRGDPHMFIIVATLKGRSEPNQNANVKKIFTTGEAVSVDFYPFSENEWVNVGGEVYVQQKYLGERPIFEDYVAQFNNYENDDIQNRKKIAERAYELAWNSNKDIEKANEMLLSVANYEKNEQLIKKLKLESLIHKNRIDIHEEENVNKSLEVLINNEVFQHTDKRFSELKNELGKAKTTIKIEEDCCYAGDTKYIYDEGEIVVDEENNYYEIASLNLQHYNVKLLINGFELDAKTTEKAFIESSHAINYYSGLDPNQYHLDIGVEWAAFIIDFKNGFPNELNIFVYP